METLVSTLYNNNAQSLPKDYVLPPERRPGKVIAPPCKTVPVIDFGKAGASGHNRAEIIQQILQASQEYGFFQVINHGVEKSLTDDTMSVLKEFFGLPEEDKASFYLPAADPNKTIKLFTSSLLYGNETAHFWRDSLKHPCYPVDECTQMWPENPTRYREVVANYSVEVRKLSMRILELMAEGLGLEPEFLQDEKLTKLQSMTNNHYPPCPDPSLALGLFEHCDSSLITVLLQGDVCGLQVLKDGEWKGIDPLPDAFVVFTGYQLHVISNGKVKSALHRAITNSSVSRTTSVTFVSPALDTVIEPAKALVNDVSPPMYRAFKYEEFLNNAIANNGNDEKILGPYRVQA